MHGIQAWVALPVEDEETEPSFAHHAGDDLPTYESGGLWARLVAGEAFGARAKVVTHSPMFYVHWRLQPGAQAAMPAEYPERAAFVASGSVEIGGQTFGAGQMVVFTPGEPSSFTAIDAVDAHAARRRAGRRAVHRMEFRLVVERAHRAGEGRLARGTHEAAGPRQPGIHPVAGRSGAARQSDVMTRVLGWRRFASPAARPRVAEGDLDDGNSASAPALHGCCPLAVPCEAVHPQPMVKGLLRGCDLLRVALP